LTDVALAALERVSTTHGARDLLCGLASTVPQRVD
jgi:hypothetical protein